MQRWGDSGSQAGEVWEIALVPLPGPGPTADLLTAVVNGSGNLELISWRPSPGGGSIDRLADSGGAAGTASAVSVVTTDTASGPKVIASMRRGSGNLELIAFQIVGEGTGAIVRTGDYTNAADSEVSQTALINLDPGRILAAMRTSGHLSVSTYSVTDVVPAMIISIAEGSAGRASRIAAGAFDDSEVVTALRNDSGDLELIGWRVAPGDFAVTREADSSSQAGQVSEVALALRGRRAVTAVRDGSDRLLLISWDVPPGLGSVTRTWDSGSTAGEASAIAMTVLGQDLLVTACRAGNGDLLVISWRFEPDGTISRLHDSGAAAGEVSEVTIAAVDAGNVVTAVRNGSGNLELIGWAIDPVSGAVQRWGDSGSQAGEVWEIALVPLPGPGPTADLLTAVVNGSGNLELISWRPSPGGGSIDRLADSGGAAGTASAVSVVTTDTASGPKVIASMRRGSGNLELIAFQIVGEGTGAIVRTGDYTNAADSEVSQTALINLDPGRILAAMRITRGCESPANHLLLTTYSVSDPVAAPAPADILAIRFQNPALPALGDGSWAESGDGDDEYPVDVGDEWVNALAPADEYEGSNLVGCTGWVVDPDDSGADMPFDHPFGFDWEFQIALDDDANGYQALLSPANTNPEGHAPELAAALGVPVQHGLLGLEWDRSVLPASFRARVNHGDRVAAFGRWILDTGHNIAGHWRTEIHPPLLVATGSVQKDDDGSELTRALFMSRPYLVGQKYTQNVDDAYHDDAGDDGTFFGHVVRELLRVITLRSRRVEAHPKIKSFPFTGSYRLHVVVRPPRRRESRRERLRVSFQFTVRKGCSVRFASTSADQVDVFISMDSAQYTPPKLPARTECDYDRDHLDKLSSGSGIKILVLEALTVAVAAQVPWGGIFLAAYVEYILGRGIRTDKYAALPEIDVMDKSSAVLDALANDIPADHGIVLNDDQHYPVFGWIETKWQ